MESRDGPKKGHSRSKWSKEKLPTNDIQYSNKCWYMLAMRQVQTRNYLIIASFPHRSKYRKKLNFGKRRRRQKKPNRIGSKTFDTTSNDSPDTRRRLARLPEMTNDPAPSLRGGIGVDAGQSFGFETDWPTLKRKKIQAKSCNSRTNAFCITAWLGMFFLQLGVSLIQRNLWARGGHGPSFGTDRPTSNELRLNNSCKSPTNGISVYRAEPA